MKENLLAKITRPCLKGILLRKRLFRLLDKSRDRPIIWISGPPGSGKTTLVSSYLDARKLPCLWYQVDEGDADLATFFYYMGLAARRANPYKRRPMPLLTSEYLLGIPTFSKRYFENLYSRLIKKAWNFTSPHPRFSHSPFLIIFDNYQDIPADSKLHDLITDGLTIIPKGINVILISRSEPPPVFARLRANNLMKIISWEELRLTLEESSAIVRLLKKRQSEAMIKDLHTRAEGWAAGLVLMLKGERTIDREMSLFSKGKPEEIFNYFASEIFNKTDREIQNFLLKTAFLSTITVQTAEKLTGLPHSERVLENLANKNYFTTRHTPYGYKYHPLFREFLLFRARACFSQKEIHRIQSMSAKILERSGHTR